MTGGIPMQSRPCFTAVNDRGQTATAPALWLVRAWAEETSRREYLVFRHAPTDPAVRLLIGGGQRTTATTHGKPVRLWVRLGAREMKRTLERESAHQRAA